MSEKTGDRNILGLGNNQAESPEKLDEYIRVSGTGTVLMILALVIALAALLVWGFSGKLPVTETVIGVVDASNEDKITCFVDASRFTGSQLMGKPAAIRLANQRVVMGTVDAVDSVPRSDQEARAMIGNDWLASNLVKDNYSLLIIIEPQGDLSANSYELAQVSVITEEVRPITFLMR